MASAAIELQNVSVEFGSELLLRDINIQISAGERFLIIGPSGQGKSVLLKIMAGLLPPTSGHVLIEQKDLLTLRGKERESLVRRMGMLFQKNALFDSLTVGENVAFPLRELLALSENEIRELVTRYLDAVGILHAKDLYPDEISGGMQKRLGIARALVLKPEIVFYDDPTAGLDPITSRKIIHLIMDLQKQANSTVVAVTNDMNRAYQMADRIGMAVDGDLLITASVEQTKTFPDERVQQFIHGKINGPLTVQA